MGTWKITTNLAGVKAVDPTRFQTVPDGVFKVEIIDTDVVNGKEGKQRLEAKVQHLEEATKGARHTVFVHLDLNKAFNKSHLRAMVESKGVPAEALEKGDVTLTDESFRGKTAYIHVANKPMEKDENGRDRQPFPDVLFIPVALYNELKKGGSAASTSTSAAATGNGATAPAGLGSIAAAVIPPTI